jgi:hypothetical protein
MTTRSTNLLRPVMFWTAVTGIFAWLPLVRIIGRPDGYTWGILGLSGAGTTGPFWIFIVLTAYVLVMLFAGQRGPRALFRPMLLIWHLAVNATVVAGLLQEGTGATLQGQGLHFEIPLWTLAVPFVGFLGLAIAWVVVDRRAGAAPFVAPWTHGNTVRLAGSLLLLAVALLLFRAGTNYNWVTAAAIVTTIGHWVLLIDAFAPRPATP